MKISTLRKALILLVLVIAVAIPAAAYTGTGTSADPYVITTAEELKMMNNSSAYFKLGGNIVVNDPDIFEYENGVISGVKDGETPEEWEPIDFSGSFVNGARYYITGLYVTEDHANGGLFGTLTNANVSTIYMDFALIESDENAGILAGKAEGTTTISDCIVSGSVIGCTTKEMNSVGGMVGVLGKDARITASTSGTGARGGASYADVTGATSYSANVGGFAGVNCGTIENVVFAGNVYGTATYYDASIGGIAGYNTGSVNNCRTQYGTVGGESTALVNDLYVGGIVGLNKGTVEYNVNGVTVSAENYSNGDSIVAVGGIVGATIDADVCESKNTGAVSGEYAYAGGIAGIAVSDTGVHYVECCDNEGAVTSAFGVAGGIVGRAVAAGEGYVSIKLYVQECNNTGDVSGNAYGEVAGETATVESAQVIIGEELSSYSGTCSANNATYITADAVQYGTKATGSVTPTGSATGTQIAGTNRWILRYRGRTTDLPSKPVMVTLITVTDASKVEILSVDVSGLSYVDGRITGNVIVEVYRPEGDVTAYDVVAGTSVGKKFADVDFASVSGSDRITHVTVPVNCAADAGEIIVNAMVVDDTETMNPVCENKYGE